MNSNLYPHVYKLWLFSCVVERKSFKRAAADASITLSALSQSISSLERVLGKTLLVRTRSAISLTQEGEELAVRALPILAAIADLTADGPHTFGGKRLRLRLGLYETSAVHRLPLLLPKLHRNFPRTTIQLATARSAALERQLRDGDLDAAVVVRDPSVGDVNSDVLAQEQLGLFVPSTESQPCWGMVARKGIAMLAPNSDGYPAYHRKFVDSYVTHLRGMGIDWHVGMTTDSIEVLRCVVADGVHAAVLPRSAAPAGAVILRPPPSVPLDTGAHDICLVTRSSFNTELRAFLRRELTRMRAVQPRPCE
jgi:DNA-binding transcriptional LysR family regulator